uniref:C3H1-type domain-containing protein n=1 Tax=Acrobeloides nanus TaxID=290746 RepID=A0A914EPP6_9BILA
MSLSQQNPPYPLQMMFMQAGTASTTPTTPLTGETCPVFFMQTPGTGGQFSHVGFFDGGAVTPLPYNSPFSPQIQSTIMPTSYALPNYSPTPTENLPNKTALCHKFTSTGYCPHREQCRYAHGLHELRYPATTQSFGQEVLRTNFQKRITYDVYKTMLCQSFMKGQCQHGNGCRFAHGKGELRLPKPQHPKHKTTLCRNFLHGGTCPYGSRCAFIHERRV